MIYARQRVALGLLAFMIAVGSPCAFGAPAEFGFVDHRDVVRGHFTQKKYLAELDKPLTSQGEFVLARGHGLIWRVKKPFQTTLVITNDALVQRHDGQTVKRLSQAERPGLKIVTGIMLAIFSADFDQLKDHFIPKFEQTADQGWQLVLTPKTEAIARMVRQIRISGRRQIRRIVIEKPGGNRSVINLAPRPTQSTEALSSREKRLLGGA